MIYRDYVILFNNAGEQSRPEPFIWHSPIFVYSPRRQNLISKSIMFRRRAERERKGDQFAFFCFIESPGMVCCLSASAEEKREDLRAAFLVSWINTKREEGGGGGSESLNEISHPPCSSPTRSVNDESRAECRWLRFPRYPTTSPGDAFEEVNGWI